MPSSPPSGRDHRTARGRAAARHVFVPCVVTLLAALPTWTTAAPPAAALDAEVRAAWTGVPLREWARRVSESTGTPVIVDRRLDPDQPITLTSDGDTLRAVLDRVASAAGATVEPLAATTRLTPQNRAGRAAAAEAARVRVVRRLPADLRRRVERRAAWNWPAAAEPRDLVTAAAAEAGLDVTGLDQVPHDHLPAAALPALQLGERLDLVLADYDLRIDWSPAGGAIVPIEAGIEPGARATPAASTPSPPRRVPQARRADVDDTVYSLRVEAALDQAVPAVAKALGLRSTIDGATLAARGIAPGEIVRVDARNLTRDELLDALARPLGLSWTIDGDMLRVFAPPAVPR
jgi:hypothetical protein